MRRTCSKCGRKYKHKPNEMGTCHRCEERAFEALIVGVLRGKNPATGEDLPLPKITDEEKSKLKAFQPGYMADLIRRFEAGELDDRKRGDTPDA